MNTFNVVLCFHVLGLMSERCNDLGTDPMLECYKLCSILETDFILLRMTWLDSV
jgi:hypothetical protein